MKGRVAQTMMGWCGGESIESLLLLIQAMQVNGCPLPIDSFTAWAVLAMAQRHTGHHPIDVDVMSDWVAVIELELDVRVGEVGWAAGRDKLPVVYLEKHN